jgi:hypothetical protein
MSTTRAKFVVQSITRSQAHIYGDDGKAVATELQTVQMNPVYGNQDPEHENTKFWKSSPSGSLSLGCINLAAAAIFELGKEYYVDFTPAE